MPLLELVLEAALGLSAGAAELAAAGLAAGADDEGAEAEEDGTADVLLFAGAELPAPSFSTH